MSGGAWLLLAFVLFCVILWLDLWASRGMAELKGFVKAALYGSLIMALLKAVLWLDAVASIPHRPVM
jgi:uncharacterized membrane protein YvlD (DUF360 family)